MAVLVVRIGELKVASGGDKTLEVPNITSGISVIMLEKQKIVAGAIHALLPKCNSGNRADLAKFSDTGVTLLLAEMENQGASRHDLVIKVIGGSDLMGASSFSLGQQNVEMVKKVVAEQGLSIGGLEVGGRRKRDVVVRLREGKVLVKHLMGEPIEV